MTSEGNTQIGRRVALLLAAIMAALVLSSGVALALNQINCASIQQYPQTPACYGTPLNDAIGGREAPDIIYAYAGDDLVNARSGNDVVYAGPGVDFAHGDEGDDQMYGARGAFFDMSLTTTAKDTVSSTCEHKYPNVSDGF
jgi:Ca2+-binding RTX toxin-like protein